MPSLLKINDSTYLQYTSEELERGRQAARKTARRKTMAQALGWGCSVAIVAAIVFVTVATIVWKAAG